MKMLQFRFFDSACISYREDAIRLAVMAIVVHRNYATNKNAVLQNEVLKSVEHSCFISPAGSPRGDTEYLKHQAWSLLEHQGREPSLLYKSELKLYTWRILRLIVWCLHYIVQSGSCWKSFHHQMSWFMKCPGKNSLNILIPFSWDIANLRK